MISTPRLDLVPTTPSVMRAALSGGPALPAVLGAELPAAWTPEYYGRQVLEYTL